MRVVVFDISMIKRFLTSSLVLVLILAFLHYKRKRKLLKVYGGGPTKTFQTPLKDFKTPYTHFCNKCGQTDLIGAGRPSKRGTKPFKHDCREIKCINCDENFPDAESFNAHLNDCNQNAVRQNWSSEPSELIKSSILSFENARKHPTKKANSVKI